MLETETRRHDKEKLEVKTLLKSLQAFKKDHISIFFYITWYLLQQKHQSDMFSFQKDSLQTQNKGCVFEKCSKDSYSQEWCFLCRIPSLVTVKNYILNLIIALSGSLDGPIILNSTCCWA